VAKSTPRTLNPREGRDTIVQEAGWPPGLVWTGVENPAPPGFDTRTFRPVASRYNDYAVVAHIPNSIIIIIIIIIIISVGNTRL